ncbi:hypothetical protein E4U54_007745 [Claviceps lovelessii]|nr:hypothetical protein E4U54_007745 [Claviceps lovelessii]
MLAAVFGAGFAFEVYDSPQLRQQFKARATNASPQWFQQRHQQVRQWKDIRNKYVEGGDEDEE